MERTLVLGAGFGGIAVATGLRERLGDEHEVLLVDRSPDFSMGLRKLWQLVGLGTIAEGSRPRAALSDGGIEVVRAEVTAIDPSVRAADTSAGRLEADRLVIALGAEGRPELVPGLTEHGFSIWSRQDVEPARRRLASLREGRIALVVCGAPYPCPPAPYECLLLVDDHLRARGDRDRFELAVTTPQPMLLPNAGRAGSDWIAERLGERGIAWQVDRRPTAVEPGRVLFAEGDDLGVDMLLAVPPHRAPAVLEDCGLLAESGWIEPDAGTLATPLPGVWAVGDCTLVRLANGLPLPKAGMMAAAQGEVVAARIAAEVAGRPALEEFDGRGYCYLETGLKEAALIEGDFYVEPEPAVRLHDPAERHREGKLAFEREHLARWFGD